MEGTGIVHQYYFLSMAAREFFLSSAQIHMIAVITEFQIHGKKKEIQIAQVQHMPVTLQHNLELSDFPFFSFW